MDKYVCTICGYVYDPETGDPDNGVAAGTKAASKARRDDPSMEITIITQEKYISYAGCGLAYYVGGVVDNRSKLFARSPETFVEKYNIDVPNSFMIGDSFLDVQAGQQEQLNTVFLGQFKCDTCQLLGQSRPNHIFDNLYKFAKFLEVNEQ